MTEHRFETPQPVALYVEIGSGTIDVTAEESAESRVSVSGRDADRVHVQLDGDRLDVVGPKDRGSWGRDRDLDVVVVVPSLSRLAVRSGSADLTVHGPVAETQVKTGSGDVAIDRVDAAADLETGSGDVRLGTAAGPLRVKSGSGDLEVERAADAVQVSTGSGDVDLRVAEGAVLCKTGSGDVTVTEALADVQLSTGSGDLVVGTAHRGRITAKGASGDVRIGVQRDVPVWTDVSTVSGDLRSDLNGAGQPEDGADHLELRVKTVSGDIVLTER